MEKGWLKEPPPVSQNDKGVHIACKRFVISQGEKVSCCDDLRRYATAFLDCPLNKVTLLPIPIRAYVCCRVSRHEGPGGAILWIGNQADGYK